MVAAKFPPWLAEKIKIAANLPQTPISLQQMVQFGKSPAHVDMLRATQFVREELPIRLARRVAELENLPYDLSNMPSIGKVKQMYTKSFQDLLEFPRPETYDIPVELVSNARPHLDSLLEAPTSNESPHARHNVRAAAERKKIGSLGKWFGGPAAEKETQDPPIAQPRLARPMTPGKSLLGRYYDPLDIRNSDLPPSVVEYNEQFAACLENIKRRHDPVVTTMAQGIVELKEHWRRTSAPHIQPNLPALLPTSVQSFLDRFYLSRIGIRMLIGQHIALQQASMSPDQMGADDYVGIICTRTSLKRVCTEAIEDATFICRDYFGLYSGPKVDLIFPVGREDLEFMYVPSHLHHMLFELMKNSLRAVVERYGIDVDEEEWPAVQVVVAEGQEDITIKVADEGGGIPRSGMPMVWTYMYTTASTPMLEENYNRNDFKAPMAGM